MRHLPGRGPRRLVPGRLHAPRRAAAGDRTIKVLFPMFVKY